MRRLLNLMVVGLLLLGIASAANAALIFSDNFNDGDLVGWATSSWISAGIYANSNYADGQISVNFGSTAVGTPIEARFKVYQTDQSPGYFTFDFGLRNSADGKFYQENAAPNSGYYGSPSSGFHGYNSGGQIVAGLIPGACLWAAGWGAGGPIDPRWDYMKFKFTPGTGVEVWQATDADNTKAYTDPSLTYRKVAEWVDFNNMPSVDEFYMERAAAGRWFVDDVEIDGTAVPEPGSILAVAVGLVGMIGAVRRKH